MIRVEKLRISYVGDLQWHQHPLNLGAPRGWSILDGISVDDDVSVSTFTESRANSFAGRSRIPSSVCLPWSD